MKQRIAYFGLVPEAVEIMQKMETYIQNSSIDPKLVELIKIRVSQINGCSFCLNMHTKDAREKGETEQRIYCLNAWRECEFYSDQERAALALAEHVTLVSTQRVPDDIYEETLKYFSKKEYMDLIFIINQINSWNRISIATGIIIS